MRPQFVVWLLMLLESAARHPNRAPSSSRSAAGFVDLLFNLEGLHWLVIRSGEFSISRAAWQRTR